ncbi:methyltransferase domain-containing protein [Pontibaca salina]|uniref:Methyltransferase domain-containing protein n=1 Tax=Pontibaca salina TaxID=2795731 RepID=A0A934HMH7_9RHOB|nr:methyltransferase domain-containing protein [Pontibaca salina]MBI6630813.1 methyltransferase domain-containing protein [Pontibaca salina]
MSFPENAATTGQVTATAAEIYDAFFVPALFGEWARPLCDAAGIASGVRVIDIACGTGATTRAAQTAASPGGEVMGLDRNTGMLSVARARSPDIAFIEGRAEALPFPDQSFDVVLCQFGLMFFEDRAAALQEMRRVLRPDGHVALSVWDQVETSPGYARMIALLNRLFGKEEADALRAPFVLGKLPELQAQLARGGMRGAKISTQTGMARFESIAEWVRTDVRGWTLADMIDDDQYAALADAAEREFGDLTSPDGLVCFPAPAHIVTWPSPR